MHQIYSANNCHFRTTVADQVIGLLLGRSLTKMRNANPNAVHILVVCSWNCTGDTVHSEMNATADLCHSETLSEVEAVAARHTNKGWVFRPFLEPPAVRRRPMPLTLFRTYMHDDHPGPPAMCREFLADFDRTFATTRSCFRLSSLHAGDHKADVSRYVYHYHYGGLCLDIKIAMRIPGLHGKGVGPDPSQAQHGAGALPKMGYGRTAQRVYDPGYWRQE